jgi:hypothetical protein
VEAVQTWGEAFSTPPHHSLWRARLATRAGTVPLGDYLVLQANLRGYLGAYGSDDLSAVVDAELSLEEIVVGLLGPTAPAEGRALKLILRMLQSGDILPDRLVRLARQERAENALWWLLQVTPPSEQNAAVLAIRDRMRAPRGYALPRYAYDPKRLLRRPATREAGWRTPPK